jgi:hypothetical protein
LIARAARLAAAAVTAILAVSQVRSWRAERAYEAGLGALDPRTGREAADQPAQDVPGRLESYELARETDPRNPLYALRTGQILLQRATRGPRTPETGRQLASAIVRLEESLRLHPLDGRAHDALAQARLATGELDESVDRTRRSVRAAPRRPATLGQAAARCARIWLRSSDPDALVVALDAARLGFELSDGRPEALGGFREVPGTGPVAEILLAPSAPTVGELRWMLRGRDDLRETAARLVEERRPDDAAALRKAGP